jgi:hypothetical protein
VVRAFLDRPIEVDEAAQIVFIRES